MPKDNVFSEFEEFTNDNEKQTIVCFRTLIVVLVFTFKKMIMKNFKFIRL